MRVASKCSCVRCAAAVAIKIEGQASEPGTEAYGPYWSLRSEPFDEDLLSTYVCIWACMPHTAPKPRLCVLQPPEGLAHRPLGDVKADREGHAERHSAEVRHAQL